MDRERVAERVAAKFAGRGKEYKEYFEKKLKKWDVKSPAEIPDDKKDEFFEEVDAGWQAEGEKKEASRTASVKVREFNDSKGHRWAYDAGDYFGWVQEFEGPGIPLYRIMVSFPDGSAYQHKRQVKDFRMADKIVRATLNQLAGEGSVIMRDWKEASSKKAGTVMGPGVPDGTGPMRGTGECPFDDEGDDEDVVVGSLMMRRGRMAGCEKLPAGPMRENCEKKSKGGDGKKDDKKDDSKGKDDKKDGKMPAELLDKFKKKKAKKGEVPEAFKKQWKNKDKDGDGKENEPKPDFLKKKEKEAAKVEAKVLSAVEVVPPEEVPEEFKRVLQKIGYAGYAKRWTMSSNGRSLYAHIGNAVLGASEIRVLDSSKEVIGLTGDDVTIMFNQ